jgi:hypothetical protein
VDVVAAVAVAVLCSLRQFYGSARVAEEVAVAVAVAAAAVVFAAWPGFIALGEVAMVVAVWA